MLWTISIIFALLWVLGLVTTTTFGGAIHILLGVSVALLLIAVYRLATSMERRRGAPLSPKSASPTPGAKRSTSTREAAHPDGHRV